MLDSTYNLYLVGEIMSLFHVLLKFRIICSVADGRSVENYIIVRQNNTRQEFFVRQKW